MRCLSVTLPFGRGIKLHCDHLNAVPCGCAGCEEETLEHDDRTLIEAQEQRERTASRDQH